MTDIEFHLLLKFESGSGMSRAEKDWEAAAMAHTDGVNLNRAWEYLERERYIQGDGPITTQNTIFKISDLGKAAIGKERRERQSASATIAKKLQIEDLQEQLLNLSIHTSNSTLETNQSIRELNEATKKNLTWQKWLTLAIAFFTAVQVAVSFLQYRKPDGPQLVEPKVKQQVISQPSRQPSMPNSPKVKTEKDSV